MKKFPFILLLTLLAAALCLVGRPPQALAQSTGSGSVVRLQVDNCNNNGICEPQFGENYQACPLDCTASTTPPATSTPSNNPPPTYVLANSGTPGGLAPIDPKSISITFISDSSVIIEWRTYGDYLESLSWGKTTDTEIGTIAEINFGSVHRIELDNLDPDSRYFFKIESKSRLGVTSYSNVMYFLTHSHANLPANISDFNYSIQGSAVLLSWKNPPDKNFQSVRILRSSNFYPKDPNEGQPIYEGDGNSFLDTNVSVDTDYYYSAFAEDTSGNFSSGATLHLKLISSPRIAVRTASPPQATSSTINILSNVSIEQNDKQVHFFNGQAEIITDIPTKFILSPDNLPSNISEVILSVEDENSPGTFNSYMMRQAANDNNYDATIAAFGRTGKFLFYISLIDGAGKTIDQAQGILDVSRTFPLSQSLARFSWWWLLLLFVLALIIWLIGRSRRRR